MTKEQEVLQKAEFRLNEISTQLIVELDLLTGELSNNNFSIFFEISANGFDIEYSIINGKGEVETEKKLFQNLKDNVLSSHFVVDIDDYNMEVLEENKEYLLFFKNLSKLFIDWFTDCWQKTSLSKNTKGNIAFFDADDYFDLNNQIWKTFSKTEFVF